MVPHALSTCITTDKIDDASRSFYVQHFGARVVFDCGWYINLKIGQSSLQFMEPQGGQEKCNPNGVTHNFHVEDVDRELAAILASGLTPTLPIEDHPSGDRGFGVLDPNGLMLYVYSDREPSAEFKPFFKD